MQPDNQRATTRRHLLFRAVIALVLSGITGEAGQAESDIDNQGRKQSMDTPSPGIRILTPVPIQAVIIDDPFWTPKRKIWRDVTIATASPSSITTGAAP